MDKKKLLRDPYIKVISIQGEEINEVLELIEKNHVQGDIDVYSDGGPYNDVMIDDSDFPPNLPTRTNLD